MPSDKKRVNLTIPDDLYQRIQEYKQRQGVTNDASACLQLIVQLAASAAMRLASMLPRGLAATVSVLQMTSGAR